jgi:hypothetical protein
MSRNVVVNIPFPGFYESDYSRAVDHEEESHCYYIATEGEKGDLDYEPAWPEELRLSASDLGEILLRETSYDIAYAKIATNYVASFDNMAGETLGFSVPDVHKRFEWQTKTYVEEPYRRDSIRMTFESMDSPREYNFATDRLYGEMPLAIVYLMFRRSRAEGHATLAKTIKDRFTSYDGFIAYYPTDIEDWLEKPLGDWDHNELGTLLLAVLQLAGADPEDLDLYEETVGDERAYQAWSEAVDWEAFDKRRLEERAEKLEAWLEEDKEAVYLWRAHNLEAFDSVVAADPGTFKDLDYEGAPYRCQKTPDLFDRPAV